MTCKLLDGRVPANIWEIVDTGERILVPGEVTYRQRRRRSLAIFADWANCAASKTLAILPNRPALDFIG
jgi:hypothetical protein